MLLLWANGYERSFGLLADEFERYKFDGQPNHMQMQNYKNVTNPCLFGEKLDDEIINIIPPLEYHLYE